MKFKAEPNKPGYYWVKNMMSAAPARIVRVSSYKVGGDLFTDDYGGPRTNSKIYENSEWLGPLKEPHPIFGDEII